jgi:hypothetical protein
MRITEAAETETWGLRRIIPRWIGHQKVKSLVRNWDSKSGTVIRDNGWNVIQILDSNDCEALGGKWDAQS